MDRTAKISDAELEVMHILWNNHNTATSAFIHQQLSQKKAWKLNTVITFLARLTEKGYVKADKKGRGKPSQYIAVITEEKYKQLETHMFLDVVHKGSVKSLVATLCEEQQMSSEEIQQVKEWFLEHLE